MNYEPGDRIIYQTFGGERRLVKVLERHGDVKNGLPGFDAEIIGGGEHDGMAVWGYDYQIVATPQRPDGIGGSGEVTA